MNGKRHRVTTGLLVMAGAIAAAAIPWMIGADSSTEDWVNVLRGAAVLAFIGAGLYMLFARGDAAATGRIEPPRDRPASWNDPASELSTARRVEVACEQSVAYGRTLGLIHLDLACWDDLVDKFGTEAAEATMRLATEAIRGRMRIYDRVERVENDQFIVMMAYLRQKSELMMVGMRLVRFVQKMKFETSPGQEFPCHAGFAIHPMDGYSGEDLILSAQTASHAERADRQRAEMAALALREKPETHKPKRPRREGTGAHHRRRVRGEPAAEPQA